MIWVQQEQSDLSPHCLSVRLQIFKWMAKNIHLRVNKCEFSVYTVRIFMKCTLACVSQIKKLINSLPNYK